jgi:hypothetical protein
MKASRIVELEAVSKSVAASILMRRATESHRLIERAMLELESEKANATAEALADVAAQLRDKGL